MRAAAALLCAAAARGAAGFAVAALNTDTFKLDPTVADRVEAQRRALQEYDALCIVSVFNADQQRDWVRAMAATHPYSYVPPVGESQCGCPAEQWNATLPYFLAKPSFVAAPQLFGQFGPDYFSCSTCFFNQWDGTAASLDACNLGDVPALSQKGCYVEAGVMGNFILSRHLLNDTQFTYYSRATTLRRGGVAATLRDGDGGRHQLFCTHLQDPEYDKRAYPYAGQDWNTENELNAADYLAFAARVGDAGASQYLAGDFNVGPAHESRYAVRPTGRVNNVYASVVAAGWRNAYLDGPAGNNTDCTVCFDNTRSSSYDSIRNQTVPHASQQATHVFVSPRVHLDGARVGRLVVGPQPTRSLGTVYVTDKYGIGVRTQRHAA